MKNHRLRNCARFAFPALALTAGVLAAIAQNQPVPSPAGATMDAQIAAIREEGLRKSQVMQTLDYLCNVIGPRLTASPELKHANDWTRDQMTSWGLKNAHLESWGPFGKGWSLKHFSLEVTAPYAFPVRAFPKAWSGGSGPAAIDTEVVFLDATTEAELAKFEGTLKGKVVMIGNPRNINPGFTPTATRFSTADLSISETVAPGTALPVTGVVPNRGGRGAGAGGGRAGGRGGPATGPATAPGAGPGGGGEDGPVPMAEAGGGGGGGGRGAGGRAGAAPATPDTAPAGGGRGAGGQFPGGGAGAGVGQRALAMAAAEGAALILDSSSSGTGGVIAVSSAANPGAGGRGGGSLYSLTAPPPPPQATVAIEDYDRMARMIRLGQKLKVTLNFQVEFKTDDPMVYNTIAEIPGTDPVLKDQIVMAGAHMDSWHSGTGATDNAAGCGAVLEAARILTALNLKPRRTIRFALWSGEEQGLLGSAAYVSAHFGGTGGRGGGRGGAATTAPAVNNAPALGIDGKPIARGAEFENLSCYFNLDNGTGKVRGIYGMGNTAGGPILKKWLEPFADLGSNTVTPGTNGSTDHISFDNVGLPGFGFIQDSIDYLNLTHHTSADVYERLQAEDMRVSSTVMAALLWQAAMADDRFPRRAGAGGGRGRGEGAATAPATAPGGGR